MAGDDDRRQRFDDDFFHFLSCFEFVSQLAQPGHAPAQFRHLRAALLCFRTDHLQRRLSSVFLEDFADLFEAEPEFLEVEDAAHPLHLRYVVVAVSRPFVHVVGDQQSDLFVVPQRLDGDEVEFGKLSDFKFYFRCLHKPCASVYGAKIDPSPGDGSNFFATFFPACFFCARFAA